jgi:hypothetical protein
VFSVPDASRAIESMVLTAWSQGVGSNWVGFRGLDEVKSLLSIPAELEVLAIIPFGYPAQPIGKGKKKRKALSEVAHLERFGRPFELRWFRRILSRHYRKRLDAYFCLSAVPRNRKKKEEAKWISKK